MNLYGLLATSRYVANERASDLVGRVGSWQAGALLRDATVAYLRSHPLDAPTG